MSIIPNNTPGRGVIRGRARPVRLLLVDDSQPMLRSLSAYLEELPGINVVGTARSGAESVQKAADLRPDVVIMDFQMPGMNGLEAARQIRRSFPRVRVIILSVHGMELRLFSRAYGANAFVSKADFREKLPDEIARVCALREDENEIAH